MSFRLLCLQIPAHWLRSCHGGTSAMICYSVGLAWFLAQLFGRIGLCLKIFRAAHDLDYEWERVPLWETAVVQNLFAADGMAPAVYAIVRLNGGVIAEVLDYVAGEHYLPRERMEAFWYLVERYHIGTRTFKDRTGALKWDVTHPKAAANWVGGKLVDFGGKYRRALYPEWEETQPQLYKTRVV